MPALSDVSLSQTSKVAPRLSLISCGGGSGAFGIGTTVKQQKGMEQQEARSSGSRRAWECSLVCSRVAEQDPCPS